MSSVADADDRTANRPIRAMRPAEKVSGGQRGFRISAPV